MDKNSKNSFMTLIFFVFSVFFGPISQLQASFTSLSFDHIFPVCPYEKILERVLYVSHVFEQSYDNNQAEIPFDLVVGKIALAQYGIHGMTPQADLYLAEDIAYLIEICQRIENFIEMIEVTAQTQDFVGCMKQMIQEMQQRLSRL